MLVIDPTGQQPPAPLFSTNLLLEADEIVELFVSRWSLEVTFEEARAPERLSISTPVAEGCYYSHYSSDLGFVFPGLFDCLSA